MTDSEIEFPAKYTVFWPGQTIHCCEEHLQGVRNISRAMGMPMPDTREEEGHECENCVNSARRQQ